MNPDRRPDDASTIQQQLDSGEAVVTVFRARDILLSQTLLLPDGVTLRIAGKTRILFDGAGPALRAAPGARHIAIEGGTWIGAGFEFEGVRDLSLSHLAIHAERGPALRLRRVDGFHLRYVSANAAHPAEAAIVVAGCCRNGVVEYSSTHGHWCDGILLDADYPDAAGPVEHLRIENITAVGSGAAIRLHSEGSTIRAIRLRLIDASRALQLLVADAHPLPCGGNLDDIHGESLSGQSAATRDAPPAIELAANAYALRLDDLHFAPQRPYPSTLLLAHGLARARLCTDTATPAEFALDRDSPPLRVHGSLTSLTLDGRHPRADSNAPRVRTHLLEEPGEFLVTSPFGPRVHPVTGEVGAPHLGIDGALWDGRSLVECGICAWADGTVVEAADSDGPAGTHVVLDHGDGLVTRYFHLERGSLCVAAGERVLRGQRLGHMGRTGRATGEHLHFQMEEHGTPIDPLPRLQAPA